MGQHEHTCDSHLWSSRPLLFEQLVLVPAYVQRMMMRRQPRDRQKRQHGTRQGRPQVLCAQLP
eukprot:222507-Amphidinium_carterae.1